MLPLICPCCDSPFTTTAHGGGIVACPKCKQRLQMPGEVVEVRYAGDSWLPRWLWHPTRLQPPENSGETIVRFICNMARMGLALFVLKIALVVCAFIVIVCAGLLGS